MAQGRRTSGSKPLNPLADFIGRLRTDETARSRSGTTKPADSLMARTQARRERGPKVQTAAAQPVAPNRTSTPSAPRATASASPSRTSPARPNAASSGSAPAAGTSANRPARAMSEPGNRGPGPGRVGRTYAEPGNRGAGPGKVATARPKARPASSGSAPRASSKAPETSPRPQPRPETKTKQVSFHGETYTVPASANPRSIAEAQRMSRKK